MTFDDFYKAGVANKPEVDGDPAQAPRKPVQS